MNVLNFKPEGKIFPKFNKDLQMCTIFLGLLSAKA